MLDDGRKVDPDLFRAILAEELDKIHGGVPGEPPLATSTRRRVLFDQISTSDDFVNFLTLPAYQMID